MRNTAIQFFRGTLNVKHEPFISVWKTDNISTGSSANNQIQLPLIPLQSYRFSVNWGDGSSQFVTSSAPLVHTYSSAGTYTITITGKFPGILFENGEDRLKILDIVQWGSYRFTTHSNFYGCANLDVSAEDAPSFGTTGALQDMFRGCVKLVGGSGFALWDVSGQVNAIRTFFGCILFTGNISPWNVSNILIFTNFLNGCDAFNRNLNSWIISPSAHGFLSMLSNARGFNQPITWVLSSSPATNITLQNFLYGTNSFDQSLGNLNMSRVVNATDMLRNSGISTPNYDDTLIKWAAQTLQSNVTFHAGNSKYSTAAATARQHIIDTYNWTITDGGPA